MVDALKSASRQSFACAYTLAAQAMYRRARLLRQLLTADQLAQCQRRQRREEAGARLFKESPLLCTLTISSQPASGGCGSGGGSWRGASEQTGGRARVHVSLGWRRGMAAPHDTKVLPCALEEGQLAREAVARVAEAAEVAGDATRLRWHATVGEARGGAGVEGNRSRGTGEAASVAGGAHRSGWWQAAEATITHPTPHPHPHPHPHPPDYWAGGAPPLVTRFDGLCGWSADWAHLLGRLDAEMQLADAWKEYVLGLRQERWGRAGLIQLSSGGLTGHTDAQVGVTLLDAQLSAPCHANTLLHAARLLVYELTHGSHQKVRLRFRLSLRVSGER